MKRKSKFARPLLLAAALAWGCGNGGGRQGGGMPVSRGDVKEVVEEIGHLAAATSVEVRSEISGQVTDVLVDVGDEVKRDQVLAHVRGGFEAEDYETAAIRSPIDGVVVDRNTGPDGQKVEAGDRIRDSLSGFTSGTVLMRVSKLDRMIFEVQINEMDALKVRPGQSCEVHVDAVPDRVYRGRLALVSPVAKPGENSVRVFKTEVRLLDRDARLRPGMTARAKIEVNRCEGCVRLSLARYYKEECGGKTVDVAYVAASGEPERRVLEVAATDGEVIGVREGLGEGDVVVQRPEGRPTPEECAGAGGGWKGKWKK